MNTLRNELKEKYSQIPNELITDLTLSSGALRVLLYLFTKPDNWNVYNADICKQLDISEKTLTKYWNELLSSKWLRREKKQTKDGKFTGGYSYLIGSFTISEKSSESVECSDNSNNKLIQKKETNKTNNIDPLFIEYKKQNENASEVELNLVMDFIDYRKSIKDKIKTILPAEMYIKELKKLQKLGYKINDCIETMKINEWKTIKTEYIHKPTKNNQSRSEEVMR